MQIHEQNWVRLESLAWAGADPQARDSLVLPADSLNYPVKPRRLRRHFAEHHKNSSFHTYPVGNYASIRLSSPCEEQQARETTRDAPFALSR